jgi:hypothetical protein
MQKSAGKDPMGLVTVLYLSGLKNAENISESYCKGSRYNRNGTEKYS